MLSPSPLNIAYYRKRAGLSQVELATQLRIRRETLSRLEHGRQYLTEGMELRIARALNLSNDERNHMLGLPLRDGVRTHDGAPGPDPKTELRLVAGRRSNDIPERQAKQRLRIVEAATS